MEHNAKKSTVLLNSKENDILRNTFAVSEIIVKWHRALYATAAKRSLYTQSYELLLQFSPKMQ